MKVKKNLGFAFLAALSLTAGGLGAETYGTGINIPLDRDPVEWKLGTQRLTKEGRVTVLLRSGETIDTWTEIVVIKEQPSRPMSPGPFRSQFIRALRKRHGRANVTVDRHLLTESNGTMFGYEVNDEMELVRAMKQRGQGFVVVTYTCKDSKDTIKAKELYSEILKSAEMTGVYKVKKTA